MILLLINQNRKRKKDAQNLLDSLTVGSEAVLHSGIMGQITAVSETEIEIESTPGTKLRVVKQAVRSAQSQPSEGN